MKKMVSLLLVVIVFAMGLNGVLFAQEVKSGDEIFIVERSLKIYSQPRRFSKVSILETGTVLRLDPYFEDGAFLKVVIEKGSDVKDGYVIADDLHGSDVSPASSSDLSTGEGSTASARGSMGQENNLSLGSLDFSCFGDASNVNKMEQKSANIPSDIWSKFRNIGLLGEFLPALFSMTK